MGPASSHILGRGRVKRYRWHALVDVCSAASARTWAAQHACRYESEAVTDPSARRDTSPGACSGLLRPTESNAASARQKGRAAGCRAAVHQHCRIGADQRVAVGNADTVVFEPSTAAVMAVPIDLAKQA